MNLTLQILGAASAMPISDMNPSAQALRVHGRLLLIDCVEGPQQQMRRQHLSFLKVKAVFISHIHGDHIFGIFGVLSTMAMYGRTEALDLFAPKSFAPILKFYLSYFSEGMNYEINFHPLDCKQPELVYELRGVPVYAFPLRHKIDCFGYRFGDWYAYCSDTAPFPELAGWLQGVRTIYHETTYLREWADKAGKYYHSTTDDAARCARDAGAKHLLIGHYTSRVRDYGRFASECREIFPQTTAVRDGDVFEID